MSSFKHSRTVNLDLKDAQNYTSGSRSPKAPPYSPISPVMQTTFLNHDTAGQQQASPSQPPPMEPFLESENTDAIALRSAIAILQIQRQQAIRDIQALERQKLAATADPEAFARDVATGKLKTVPSGVLEQTTIPFSKNEDDAISDGDTDMGDCPPERASKFEDVPGPQNVVRCPPINWAKYHILGEPLDKLHEEQKMRPSGGQPGMSEPGERGEEHVIAAPYNPWKDKMENTVKTRTDVQRAGKER
ncbi:MAG: hypothetical protein Q9214_001063 [Letrouitia sp. 1 TL-2023]